VLAYYENLGVLDQTYVMVIADHGHTPVVARPQACPWRRHQRRSGRGPEIGGIPPAETCPDPGPNEQDYQSAVAYQGAIGYVYLADRSTCRTPGTTCDWKRPPRWRQDVLPVAKAFYDSNKTGKPVPQMKDTLDLIFARVPTPAGKPTMEYQIFRRPSAGVYCGLPGKRHPRPDLIQPIGGCNG